MTRRGDAAALLGLLALATVQLWPLAGPGRLPQNLDLMLQYVPNQAYLARSLAAVRLPLWNPYLGGGMPFAADPGTGTWYLPSWPLLLTLPLYAAVRATLWLHLLWAAGGTYLYLRAALRVGPVAAWVGAAAFALTTWLPALSGMAVVLTCVSWLPWLLWLGGRAAAGGGRWVALLAAAGALQLASGWPAGVYLAWGALFFLNLCRWPGWAGLRRLATAAALSALLGGMLLVPALEFVGQTNYAQTRPLERVAHEGYLTLLSWFRPAGGSGSLESSQLYLGTVPLVLAIAGAAAVRRREAAIYGGLALGAVLLAAGTHGPLFAAFYRWLPGFRIVYLPARLGILASFALSCLAALGVEALGRGALTGRRLVAVAAATAALGPLLLAQFWWSEGYDSFRRLLTNLGRVAGGPYLTRQQEAHYALFGALALLVVSGAAWRRARPNQTLPGALVALVVLDLALAQRSAAPTGFDPAAWYTPALQAGAQAQEAVGHERLAGLQWHGTQHFLNDFPRSADPALLPPNLALLASARDAQAYNPLLLRRAAAYYGAYVRGLTDDHWLWLDDFASPAIDRLAVRRVLASGAEWRVTERFLAGAATLPADGREVPLWRGAPLAARSLRVISYLGEATDVRQGTPAIALLVRRPGAEPLVATLRAGVETAEWAYGRPEVNARIQHQQAPVALETRQVDAVAGVSSVFAYQAQVALDAPVQEVDAASQVRGVAAHVDSVRYAPAGPPEWQPVAGGLQRAAATARLRVEGPQAGTTSFVVDEPERIVARVSAPGGGRLVLSDLFYPGWTATVDGRPAAIEAAEDTFRAVSLEPGAHEVTLAYRPPSLWLGAALSVLGLLGLVPLLGSTPGARSATR